MQLDAPGRAAAVNMSCSRATGTAAACSSGGRLREALPRAQLAKGGGAGRQKVVEELDRPHMAEREADQCSKALFRRCAGTRGGALRAIFWRRKGTPSCRQLVGGEVSLKPGTGQTRGAVAIKRVVRTAWGSGRRRHLRTHGRGRRGLVVVHVLRWARGGSWWGAAGSLPKLPAGRRVGGCRVDSAPRPSWRGAGRGEGGRTAKPRRVR